jgi:glutamate/tyrosine decarboxylase-like PLP-dependent enzyme
MHEIDIQTVELTLDVMKYALQRITNDNPEIGFPKRFEELKKTVGQTITREGIGGESAFKLFKDVLIKATIPIDHPKHLAFVPAAPSRASLMFDLVTAVSSIHGSYWMEGAGAIFCEMEAMSWLVELTGMPKGSFGVFTSGGTAANLSAIVAAREYWRSQDESRKNKKGILITSYTAHSSVKAMAKVIDAEVIIVDTNEALKGYEIEVALRSLNKEHRDRVFAVIATSGTTNAGIIDNLDEIADVCEKYKLWFHVDGAYGGAALAVPEVRPQFSGIEKADSFTIDPHKWLFAPYDCGAIIYKNPELAKKAHSQHGSYLKIFDDAGAEGFNPSDYQIQLTRRVRGMPLWFSLAMHGTEIYEQAIRRGIELAALSGKIIRSFDHLELVREPSLSVVLFRRIGWSEQDYTNWTYENQKKKFALVTPTFIRKGGQEEMVARFCFINPDTTEEDILSILDTMK